VQKPQKGAPTDPRGQLRKRLERSGRRLRLRGAAVRVTSLVGKARERRQVEILAEAFVEALEGQNPREHPAVCVLKTTQGRQGLPEGAKPRNRGLPSRPSLRCGYTGRRNGKWGLPPGNGMDTFRKEKAPKGESQERCRCETEPARNCGE
jgi:hypothetical protein